MVSTFSYASDWSSLRPDELEPAETFAFVTKLFHFLSNPPSIPLPSSGLPQHPPPLLHDSARGVKRPFDGHSAHQPDAKLARSSQSSAAESLPTGPAAMRREPGPSGGGQARDRWAPTGLAGGAERPFGWRGGAPLVQGSKLAGLCKDYHCAFGFGPVVSWENSRTLTAVTSPPQTRGTVHEAISVSISTTKHPRTSPLFRHVRPPPRADLSPPPRPSHPRFHFSSRAPSLPHPHALRTLPISRPVLRILKTLTALLTPSQHPRDLPSLLADPGHQLNAQTSGLSPPPLLSSRTSLETLSLCPAFSSFSVPSGASSTSPSTSRVSERSSPLRLPTKHIARSCPPKPSSATASSAFTANASTSQTALRPAPLPSPSPLSRQTFHRKIPRTARSFLPPRLLFLSLPIPPSKLLLATSAKLNGRLRLSALVSYKPAPRGKRSLWSV